MSTAARVLAGNVVAAVRYEGRSLNQVLPAALANAAALDRALVQELAYGTLRWLPRLEALLAALMRRPLKNKDRDINALLLVGLYQVALSAIAPHAAVHASVEAVRATGKSWAVSLVNGILRAYQRKRETIEAQADATPSGRYAHPDWLIEQLQSDWPQDWQSILHANNGRPPFVLRVNPRRVQRDEYLRQLQAAGLSATPITALDQAVYLPEPVAVERLPGFAQGAVSVQDAAAQWAAPLLALAPGMRVLDACAAPGGKTAHILESLKGATLDLTALDIDAERSQRIAANLQRLGLQAQLLTADAATPQAWWDGRVFERILLDAPCSASGVIRRHPDIKSLRRASDVDALARVQASLLDALWPLLAPGGMLLYVTCSVLRRENEAQIAAFMQRHHDVREQTWLADWGTPVQYGRQILPGTASAQLSGVGMDGFFYAGLVKQR